MRERFVFVLVSLNPDGTDLSGTVFKKSGYIESKNYLPGKDIRNGLYGTLWGRVHGEHWLNSDPDATWRVVKVENNNEIIPIDPMYNFVKFRKGTIVSSGTKEECSSYICANCPQKETCDKDECKLVALKTEMNDKSGHVFRQGACSVSETDEAACHAINAGDAGLSKTSGWRAHSVALGGGCKAESKDEESISFVAGESSQSIAKHKGGIAISASLDSSVIAGRRGCAVGLGEFTIGQAGVRGFVALKYNDGKRDRLKVGYVGEDIEANKFYRVTPKGEFEVVELETLSNKGFISYR